MVSRLRLWWLIGLGLAGCASPGSAAAGPAASCSLLVSFGSYAMGIDRGAAIAIGRLLDGHAEVAGVSRRGAGREGEFELCVEARSAEGAERLFEEIRRLIPARPRGPIRLEAPGRVYSVPRR